jgi:transcriptional regulator with XRE-family HTH domain
MRTAHKNLIRSARERAGLSREQLAVKAGLSGSTLYLAERAGLISAVTAAKIAPILGLREDELREECLHAEARGGR